MDDGARDGGSPASRRARPNAGSIFKNPPGDYAGRLIEAAGLERDARRAGADLGAARELHRERGRAHAPPT